ncbi:D-alanyl-D-alanine dipeptidase (macronuclear) [Tetrahymena thermophila SB210]|uniref:D-alanyl-D-alanine dipeptidase n=1 Tax=Tetrahymena thermophila (strain SB210) TaxID=312017 RepID=I7MKK4_TETTS|nr:D-alanyl-D-alanine dipeptidase [Tetrahymena thermophila SB210]EAR99446.1 D-alanyl-D-alanine dipeptidase [Tetrahymena thermophila SB210]|eukprot:XP_001019691.1 D-alanyl-D-alanine dipeptidase [Tetrahymena thermophila SB210]
MLQKIVAILLICNLIYCIPQGFVYLSEFDPTILQDIRYHGFHNFVGRPIVGYNASECILTIEAAQNISLAQKEFLSQGYSIKVYDCYRPQKAVEDFYQWSLNFSDSLMKNEFYPLLNKDQLFPDYISRTSNHCKGSTLDLALVKLPAQPSEKYYPGMNLTSCFANITERFHDNIIDFGTGFDCMDPLSNTANPNITSIQAFHRQFLNDTLAKYGFVNYAGEWWHYTLTPQPYETSFDFNVDPIDKIEGQTYLL